MNDHMIMDTDGGSNGKIPIAVVGIGCRMPGGVTNPQEFWDVLINGREMITEIPPDRWSIESFYDSDQSNHSKMVAKKGGFIHGIDQFDNRFFKISPREAASMDPQQRHILEVTYEAFQDAGMIPEIVGNTCGVYIGIGNNDYKIMQLDPTLINPYTITGMLSSAIANRISYTFNFRGPSVAVDTACASSATAMHMACCAIWNGECSMAVAGGCNAIVRPETTVAFSALGVLSPESKCCPFSDTAKGYVRSEGWGVFILKPLNAALEQNDHVYAIIRGSAIGASGFSSSLTIPSAQSQQTVIRNAYKPFNIPISSVKYVEAHGTGTPVGDPIEASAIAATLGAEGHKPLKIGSVKSNFGHNEFAAGITAAIKVVLMLQHKQLVPTINFNKANPAIDLKTLKIQTDIEKITETDGLYTIGLNSFGIAGAAAHMVFQEAPTPVKKLMTTCGWSFGEKGKSEGKSIIIPLSAKTPEALKDLANKWLSFTHEHDALSVSSWQATRREHHLSRMVVIANSAESFCATLTSYTLEVGSNSLVVGTANQTNPKICYVFPGQGQQWINMGRRLFEEEYVFRDSILESDRVFKELSGWSIVESCGLFGSRDIKNRSSPFKSDEEALTRVTVIQPAIIFFQVGMYHLLRHWGIEPHVVVGHSLGEVTAAYVCGGLTLKEAIAVTYHRSHEQTKLAGCGSMAALRASIEQARLICQQHPHVYIAAINGPVDITLAGDSDAIEAIVANNPGKAKQLRVTSAFHTREMDPIKNSYYKAMRGVINTENRHTVPCYSTVTGHYYEETFNAHYWWNNIRNTVLFQNAIEEIVEHTDIDIFLEVSASATLLSCVNQIVHSVDPGRSILSVNTSLRGQNDLHHMQRALGSLYVAGVDVNWNNVTKNAAQWTPIPTYPWQHQSFWLETDDHQKCRLGTDDKSFKGKHGKITLLDFPFLADHVLDNHTVFPGAGYVEYITQMSFDKKDSPWMMDINFTKTLTWPEDSEKNRSVLNLNCNKNGKYVEVQCEGDIHCKAIIKTHQYRKSEVSSIPVERILQRCNKLLEKEAHYNIMQRIGLNYGPTFRVVEKVFMGDSEVLAYLSPCTDTNQRVSIPHLDATFQLALASIDPCTSLYIPVHIDSLHMTTPSIPKGATLVVYIRLIDKDSKSMTADITMTSNTGAIMLEVKGFRAQNYHGNQSDVDIDSCIYTTQWQPISACTLPPSVILDVFDESYLNTTYSDEMNAIRRAEEVLDDVESICASYIRHALATVPDDQRYKGQSYEKYISRLNTIASSTAVKHIPHYEIPKVIERIQTKCPELKAEICLTKTFGEALHSTLHNSQVAEPMTFYPKELKSNFYNSLSTTLYYKVVAEAVCRVVAEALKHKRVVRIIEIGARNGSLTHFIVEPLSQFGLTNQLQYFVTDVSHTLFKKAKEHLSMYPFIQFKQMDINSDVSQEKFVPGSFDVVICFDTLHAAIDLQRSTSFMENLLTSDGLMFIIERTNTHFLTELWFSALDIYWAFDDFRKESCWLNRQGWTDVMHSIGLQDVTSASTPKEFIYSVLVGRKQRMAERQLKTEINSELNTTTVRVSLMIVHDFSERFELNIDSSFNENATYLSYSNAEHLKHVFKDQTLVKTEVVYIYSDADSNLQVLCTLLQAVEQSPDSVKRVWVITKGANKESTNVNASLHTGFARAFSNRVPHISVHSVDFDNKCNLNEMFQILGRLLNKIDLPEKEVVIRDGVCYAPRIVQHQLRTNVVSSSWRIEQEISQTKIRSVTNLAFHNVIDFDIPPGHVKIGVRAASLNFKDVLMSMGLLEGLELEKNPSFGIDCAGVVEELGEGVTNLQVGDEVIAFSGKCLATHVICNTQCATIKPRGLNWIDSSSIGIVFVTAYFSLVEQANLRSKETVVIHSACGGVGLAAIQIARMMGAKVICTAGTEEKRKYLRDVLGVELVSDSRSTQFYDDIMSFTEGRGVDVVLNSLSGKLLSASMSVLAPSGRFCEIGKRDILQNSNLPMSVFLENKVFISCQVDLLMRHSPETVQRLMQTVVNLFESNTLHPIPTKVYSMERMKEAFRFMSKGVHIGKIVFDIDDGFRPADVKPALQQFSSKGTYIVTGGNGGIGQALSRWLCDNGAKYIVIASRHGAKTAAAIRTENYLIGNGACIHQYQIDIADYLSVKSMLENIRDDNTLPAIKGIFHLAAVFESDMENSSYTTFEKVNQILGAKAAGAKHLHSLTKDDNLNVFFLLSSISTVYGNPAQPLYCAANNFLDALAHKRHSEGLPALSIQLAPVRGAGWLEDNENTVKVLAIKGNSQIHVDEFLHVLGRLLQQNDLPVICLANQDWGLTQKFCHPSMLKFSHLVTSPDQATDKVNGSIGKPDMVNIIRSKVADLLCMPADDIDVNQSLINYGVDSLIALEMINWATHHLGVTISQLDILGGISIFALSEKIY